MKNVLQQLGIYVALLTIVIISLFDSGNGAMLTFQVGVLTWIFTQTISNLVKITRIEDKLNDIERRIKNE